MKCIGRWPNRPVIRWLHRPGRMGHAGKLSAVLSLIAVAVCPGSSQLVPLERPTSIRGVVINSATHEPVFRALVASPDSRFATFTDSQGRFEFSIPQKESSESDSSAAPVPDARLAPRLMGTVPNLLMARKPGFLPDPSGSMINLQSGAGNKEWTIALIPECLIVGKVTVANSEPLDNVQLELYRRLVQDGRARWVFTKATTSRSGGEFRFAELTAGSYKLLTRELLDRDRFTVAAGGPLFGYPPVYYPAAPGFDAAAELTLSPGEIEQADVSLTRQAYFNVKIPVTNTQPGIGLGVSVFAAGHRGPGYSLGFNGRDEAIEGLLPNGAYTVEGTTYGTDNAVAAGVTTLTVHDGTISGPAMTLLMGNSIPVIVKEEFSAVQEPEPLSTPTSGGRRFPLTGPRRYLNLILEPEDDFGRGRRPALRAPSGASDQSLTVENVLPGRYWVRVNSSRGYVASMRSGSIDLLHQPLTVAEGGSPAPIEITMRDGTAEIDGMVEGLPSQGMMAGSIDEGGFTAAAKPVVTPSTPAHVYCIPLSDSSGAFTEIWVAPDGSFHSPPLPPGAYRVLAFSSSQSDLEYRNPEAMRAYESKGPVVRLSAGQSESVRVQLITTE